MRDFTHDRHHTVDDTPYGRGAAMVMKAFVPSIDITAVTLTNTSPPEQAE
jgi:tRNA (guanine-N1)-methyltransferase